MNEKLRSKSNTMKTNSLNCSIHFSILFFADLYAKYHSSVEIPAIIYPIDSLSPLATDENQTNISNHQIYGIHLTQWVFFEVFGILLSSPFLRSLSIFLRFFHRFFSVFKTFLSSLVKVNHSQQNLHFLAES